MARLIATIPTTRTRLVATLSALALVLTACSAAAGAPGPPSASSGVMLSRIVPASITELPLTDQHGHVTDLAALHGRTVMIVPFLSLCQETCPFDTANLVQVQHALDRSGAGAKVVLMEVSVDPGRDTPARLAAYAQLSGASFELVTESPATLTAFEHYFAWYVQTVPEDDPPGIDWWTHQPLTYDVDHSDGYTLIDPSGVERFETGASPDFSGGLSPTLRRFLSPHGLSEVAHPAQPGWTPTVALASLGWMLHEHIAPAPS
ncbi:MAG: SCO family protein [Acidimicrobiales bacterium]